MNVADTFFKSAFSVDNVIFGFDDVDLKVLLIQRGSSPFQGAWALPGDLVYPHEDLDAAAHRVLAELTGLEEVYLEQVRTFGAVNRHPRGRVITTAYFSLIKIADLEPQPASFALTLGWHSVAQALKTKLAFDHHHILSTCLNTLKQRVRFRPVGFELLPPRFTLSALQHLYEAILDTKLDKRNFRKKILSMNLLIDHDQVQEGVPHRPAKLYGFDKEQYRILEAEGFNFELKETYRKARREKIAALMDR